MTKKWTRRLGVTDSTIIHTKSRVSNKDHLSGEYTQQDHSNQLSFVLSITCYPKTACSPFMILCHLVVTYSHSSVMSHIGLYHVGQSCGVWYIGNGNQAIYTKTAREGSNGCWRYCRTPANSSSRASNCEYHHKGRFFIEPWTFRLHARPRFHTNSVRDWASRNTQKRIW